MSKTDGLLESLIAQLRIKPEEMVFVGDSETQDFEPAVKAGVLGVLSDKQCGVGFEMGPRSARSNYLLKIAHLVGFKEEDYKGLASRNVLA
jgi:FMN phosphatase YigB (HAD superfamily)